MNESFKSLDGFVLSWWLSLLLSFVIIFTSERQIPKNNTRRHNYHRNNGRIFKLNCKLNANHFKCFVWYFRKHGESFSDLWGSKHLLDTHKHYTERHTHSRIFTSTRYASWALFLSLFYFTYIHTCTHPFTADLDISRKTYIMHRHFGFLGLFGHW